MNGKKGQGHPSKRTKANGRGRGQVGNARGRGMAKPEASEARGRAELSTRKIRFQKPAEVDEIYLVVSLNGGTPQTPQNDHFQ